MTFRLSYIDLNGEAIGGGKELNFTAGHRTRTPWPDESVQLATTLCGLVHRQIPMREALPEIVLVLRPQAGTRNRARFLVVSRPHSLNRRSITITSTSTIEITRTLVFQLSPGGRANTPQTTARCPASISPCENRHDGENIALFTLSTHALSI